MKYIYIEYFIMNVVFNYMNLYLMFLCIIRASMIMQIHIFISTTSIHRMNVFTYVCVHWVYVVSS